MIVKPFDRAFKHLIPEECLLCTEYVLHFIIIFQLDIFVLVQDSGRKKVFSLQNMKQTSMQSIVAHAQYNSYFPKFHGKVGDQNSIPFLSSVHQKYTEES